MTTKKKNRRNYLQAKIIIPVIAGVLVLGVALTWAIVNETTLNGDKKKWFTIYKDIESTESSLKEENQDNWSFNARCELPHTPFRTEPSACILEIVEGFITADTTEVKAEVDAFYKQLDKTGLWEALDDGKDDYPSINEHPTNEFDTKKSGSRTYRNKATGLDCHAFSSLQENNYNYLNLTFNCSGEALKPWYDMQYQRSLKKFLEE